MAPVSLQLVDKRSGYSNILEEQEPSPQYSPSRAIPETGTRIDLPVLRVGDWGSVNTVDRFLNQGERAGFQRALRASVKVIAHG